MTVGTQAEYVLGAARGFDDVLGVFWGTGVGAGLILGGKIWVGRGAAGEIGHMVVERDGAQVHVRPHRLHGGVLRPQGDGAGGPPPGGEGRAHQAVQDHGGARPRPAVQRHLGDGRWSTTTTWPNHLIERAVKALGAGIASAVNLLDVQAVVIGGGLGTRLGEPYVEKIREAMQPHLFVDQNPPEVRLSALGDLGGALGAALLVKG